MNKFVVQTESECDTIIGLKLEEDHGEFIVRAYAPGEKPFKVVSLRSHNGKLSLVRWSYAPNKHTDVLELDSDSRIRDMFR